MIDPSSTVATKADFETMFAELKQEMRKHGIGILLGSLAIGGFLFHLLG